MTRQEQIESAAYDDGKRCRRKGLGLKADGRYDYAAWRRLFERFCPPCADKDEAYQAWADGWQDECERLSFLMAGVLPCGRPF